MLMFLIASCTDESGTKKVLEDAGYHPISIGGYGFMACSEDDTHATRFKAYSADSTRIVTGCVCKGMFKGKTIRLD